MSAQDGSRDQYRPRSHEGFLGEGLVILDEAALPTDIPPFPDSADEVKVPVSVRMKTSTFEQLKVIAAQRGIAPSTQLREWAEAQVAAHLSGDDGGTLPFKPLLEYLLTHRIAS